MKASSNDVTHSFLHPEFGQRQETEELATEPPRTASSRSSVSVWRCKAFRAAMCGRRAVLGLAVGPCEVLMLTLAKRGS